MRSEDDELCIAILLQHLIRCIGDPVPSSMLDVSSRFYMETMCSASSRLACATRIIRRARPWNILYSCVMSIPCSKACGKVRVAAVSSEIAPPRPSSFSTRWRRGG